MPSKTLRLFEKSRNASLSRANLGDPEAVPEKILYLPAPPSVGTGAGRQGGNLNLSANYKNLLISVEAAL